MAIVVKNLKHKTLTQKAQENLKRSILLLQKIKKLQKELIQY